MALTPILSIFQLNPEYQVSPWLYVVVVFMMLSTVCFLFPFSFLFRHRAYRRLMAFLKYDEDRMTEEKLWLMQAESCLQVGNEEKALEFFLMYLKKCPRDAHIYYETARLLSFTDPDRGMHYLERAALLGHQKAIEQMNTIRERGNKIEKDSV